MKVQIILKHIDEEPSEVFGVFVNEEDAKKCVASMNGEVATHNKKIELIERHMKDWRNKYDENQAASQDRIKRYNDYNDQYRSMNRVVFGEDFSVPRYDFYDYSESEVIINMKESSKMTKITDAKADELRTLCERPWFTCESEAGNRIIAAAARTAIPALLDEREELIKERDEARAKEAEATCDGNRPLPFDRETLGRMVREAWVRWAQAQPAPKPSWLVAYDDLPESDREADRQIGEAIARFTLIGDAALASVSTDSTRSNQPVKRIYLSLDGSRACALLGENLQEGEAEFEPIKGWPSATYADERRAAFTAKKRLEERLGLGWTSYYFGGGTRSMTEVWKCCGCGAEAPNLIKSCDCATMCAGLSGTGRHAWMTEPCGDAEYGPDVTLGEIERHWQGVSGAFKRERDEARAAISRVIQERDKAKADADYCAKSWERRTVRRTNPMTDQLNETGIEKALDAWFTDPNWRISFADGPPVKEFMRAAITAYLDVTGRETVEAAPTPETREPSEEAMRELIVDAIHVWTGHELIEGSCIPDFWDELDTSERLADWLAPTILTTFPAIIKVGS
ncbi:MAG: hypothetical protein P4L79_09955 [Legionella sp.]|uniref:hypothetical protein n=1 Tax=Legionella sp. TaxID=459 RepID=UPI002845670D|nr:hypothetical protein [Legionella sp.]